MGRVLKWVGIALILLVILIVGAVIVLPGMIPQERILAEVSKTVESKTGRRLAIEGGASLTIFPVLSLTLHDVSLSNAPRSASPLAARASTIDLQLQLWPLLNNTVIIDRFRLTNPEIWVEHSELRGSNWDRLFQNKQNSPTSAPDNSLVNEHEQAAAMNLLLQEVTMTNGTVHLSLPDHQINDVISDIDLSAEMEGLDAEAVLTLSATFRDQTISLSQRLSSLRALLNDEIVTLETQWNSDITSGRYDTSLTLYRSDVKGQGELELYISDLRSLLDLTGITLPPHLADNDQVLQQASYEGKVNIVSAKNFDFDQFTFVLDKLAARGTLTTNIKENGAVAAGGNLILGDLDLRPYLAAPYKNEALETPQPNNTNNAPAPSTGSSAWSSEPIDFSPINDHTLAIAFSAKSLIVGKESLEKLSGTLTVTENLLELVLNPFPFYEGTAKAIVEIDNKDTTPHITKQASLEKVRLGPWLSEWYQIEDITGTTSTTFSLEAWGDNQQVWMESLQGGGEISISDGYIRQLDLRAMARNVASAFQPQENDTERTDFSTASAQFTVVNGLLRSDSIELKAPLLQMEGTASIDLPKRRVDAYLVPKLVQTLKGQSAEKDASPGIRVPIKVSGTFDQLTFKPDPAGTLKKALENPEETRETYENVKEELQQFRKDVKGTLKDVLKSFE